MSLPRIARSLGFLLALSAPAFAGTYSGIVSDATTGPIPAGEHLVTDTILVPAGQQLTVAPGAILKFQKGAIEAQGVLHAVGTAASPIVFTSYFDDGVGTDFDGTGPTVGTSGSWTGIRFRVGAAGSQLQYVRVRFASTACHWINVAAATMRDSSFESCIRGLDFGGHHVLATVEDCHFANIAQEAVTRLSLFTLPGFKDNTAVGKAVMQISGAGTQQPPAGTVPGTSFDVRPENLLGGVLVVGEVTVPDGITWTLHPGVIVKGKGSLGVGGKLRLLGSPTSPVLLTSVDDDSIGGDTYADGPTPVSQWGGIVVGGVLDAMHVDVRHAVHGVYLAGDAEIRASSFRSCAVGIECGGFDVHPVVEGCTFQLASIAAVRGARPTALQGFVGNVGTGNAVSIVLADGPMTSDVALGPQHTLDGVLTVATKLTVPPGRTLTLAAGLRFEFPYPSPTVSGGPLRVEGTLRALGEPEEPIRFTSIFEGNPHFGLWRGVEFLPGSDASLLRHVVVAEAGHQGSPAVLLESDATLEHCAIRRGGGTGLAVQDVEPKVVGCTIQDHLGPAVQATHLHSLQRFDGNAAVGNGLDLARVVSGAVTTDVSLAKGACVNGSIVVDATVTIEPTASLALGPGVVLKFAPNRQLVAFGTLSAAGTPAEPVVLTSVADDAFGGDALGDGPIPPLPGAWTGVRVLPAGAGTLRHALVRFAGGNGFSAVVNQSPQLVLEAVRVERSATRGFELYGAADPVSELVAWSCVGHGIDLGAGGFTLAGATASLNGGAGIRAGAGFTGSITGCVASGNGLAQIDHPNAAMVSYSNGHAAAAGSNGNILQDPLFANAIFADLRLLPSSPCVDAGDPGVVAGVAQDPLGTPRVLDGDLDGARRIDMGAYEFSNVRLDVSGTHAAGGSLIVQGSGKAGLATFLFAGLAPGAIELPPYGPLYLDLGAPWLHLPWAPLPHSIALPLPPSLPVPLPLTLQLLAAAPGGAGNLSNPVGGLVQ